MKFLRNNCLNRANVDVKVRGLDVLWVIHNFIRTHFTTKKVPAVALGILDKKLSWEELFMIPMTA